MKRFIIFILCLFLAFPALADSVFVLCQPDSFVNVRAFPTRSGDIVGRVEVGQELETDGVRKNGFVHLVGTGFETGEAWVHSGFITGSPVTVLTVKTVIDSTGRVACRRSIKGTRRKWLSDGQKVVIFAFSDEWSITDKGFIQTRYLGGF